MLIETVVLGSFQCNCTIIADEKTRDALIIDPGDEPDKILEIIKHYNLNVKYMLHTHAHLDHIMGTRKVKEQTNGQILLHKDDNEIYNNLKMQGSFFGFDLQDPLKVDQFIEDNQIISLGDSIKTKVIHTPGHSPGSVCFHFDNP
ncbi:MAG: MBL fold metallo-hydrolase, partial [Candidatus Sericytochromatia bacterium]|nr:MBL fold metallo-hydrolase [Candidatus Sericytochromatia bacterium]